MLTVAHLQHLLSKQPPDLEILVGGAAAQVLMRFHSEDLPDCLSLDDSDESVDDLDPSEVTVLWREEPEV